MKRDASVEVRASTLAFGVVVKCRRRWPPARVIKRIKEFVGSISGSAGLALIEETDWGSLVSPRPEPFYFLQVIGSEDVFSLCRFRQIEGGYEFLFNLSNMAKTAQEIEQFLLHRLSAEIVKREFF
jgi:hypothetical protein